MPSSVGNKKGVVPAIEGSVKTSEDLHLLYIHNIVSAAFSLVLNLPADT